MRTETVGRTFDIGGPEVLSYRELIHIYAEMAGLMPRIIFPVPVLDAQAQLPVDPPGHTGTLDHRTAVGRRVKHPGGLPG
jgi:uncharacterized protein YbjT (DUF2867 family)